VLQKRTLEKRRAPARAAEDEERGNLRRGSWGGWRLRKRQFVLPLRTSVFVAFCEMDERLQVQPPVDDVRVAAAIA
jgi:hypothetical protein